MLYLTGDYLATTVACGAIDIQYSIVVNRFKMMEIFCFHFVFKNSSVSILIIWFHSIENEIFQQKTIKMLCKCKHPEH